MKYNIFLPYLNEKRKHSTGRLLQNYSDIKKFREMNVVFYKIQKGSFHYNTSCQRCSNFIYLFIFYTYDKDNYVYYVKKQYIFG